LTTPLPVPISRNSKRRPPVSSASGPYRATFSGASVKLLIRTAPCTPCGPVTTPRQTRFAASVTGYHLDPPARSAPTAGGACGFFGGLCPLLRARLRPRLDRVVGDRGFLDQTSIAQETGDALGRQGADPEPMPDPLGFEGHSIVMRALEHRVVGPELLDEATVARAARVGDDDAVEGALLGTTARQADFQRHAVSFSYRNPPGSSPARP